MPDRIQRIRRLTFADWLAVGRAWCLLLGFRLALRWVSLERLQAIASGVGRPKKIHTDPLTYALHAQFLVRIAAKLLPLKMSCLPRALTLQWMLSRDGVQSRLRIGFGKTSSGGPQAHAWIELEGEAIGEPEDLAIRFEMLTQAQSSR